MRAKQTHPILYQLLVTGQDELQWVWTDQHKQYWDGYVNNRITVEKQLC